MIHKDGRMLLNDRCSLLYYNISQGTVLDAVQVRPVRDDLRNRVRVFVRPNYGYNDLYVGLFKENTSTLGRSIRDDQSVEGGDV
jgi:hypothetical protein